MAIWALELKSKIMVKFGAEMPKTEDDLSKIAPLIEQTLNKLPPIEADGKTCHLRFHVNVSDIGYLTTMIGRDDLTNG